MAFKKGQSGNPNGRPEGSKNKSFLDVNHWLKYADEDMATLEPGDPKRNTIYRWAAELIMAKVQVLPASPSDSVGNAASAFNLMNGLAPAGTPLESNPNAPHANGANGAE